MKSKSINRIISLIVVVSFLYSNCVYAIPKDTNSHTLSSQSALVNPEYRRTIQDLANKLRAEAMPPAEIIRIIDGHLAAILPGENANPALSEYIRALREMRAIAEEKLHSPASNSKAVISSIREFFGKEYQPNQPKAETYENIIAPFVEEHGLWPFMPILKLFGIETEKAEMPILIRIGYSTIPTLVGFFLISINYFIPVINTPITFVLLMAEGLLLALIILTLYPYFLKMHKTKESRIGATIITAIKLLVFLSIPFIPPIISVPLLVFSPFLIHSIWNILCDVIPFLSREFKAICHTMYYRDELTERIREEWEKRNRAPTQEEIDDAQKEVEEKTKELEETLSEAEQAIIEEIANDGEFATELDDETKHDLREKIIKNAGQYIRNGGKSFDEWINGLHTNLKDVFIEDSPEKIAKLLQAEKLRQSLRKVYDMADRDFLHHSPTPSGLSPLVSGALHSLQHLLGLGHEHHDHHHPPKGTTLKSIIFFIISIGAFIYYMLTNDATGVYIAMAAAPTIPAIPSPDGTTPFDVAPKPETLQKVTIDLKEYVRERKIRDYYFSSEAASSLDTAVGRGSSIKPSGILKNNVLLTGPNTELLEYIMESTVSKITSGEDTEEYPNLRDCDFLLFNAAWIVDAVAIPGTIEDIMGKLKKEIEEYYKDKRVVLFINFQDLYDLGQMEGRRMDAVAGIYMRLAGLLESKNVSVAGLASDFLAKKLLGETRMMQYFEVVPAERTEDYRIGQIIRDELAWLNDAYKTLLGENKIKMKPEEVRKLADRLAKFLKSQEPPQILKNRLEKWFTEKFLKIEKLQWEEKYHMEEIEKLINEYRKSDGRTELFEKYMHKWIEYHIEEISRIKKEIIEYEKWFSGLNDSYWLTVDEILPKEAVWEQKVPGMKEALNGEVIDQEPAINSICASFEQAQIMHDKDHPIGVFIFVGPTGVGKTEVARALSRYLSGSENELVRIDGSEHGQGADLYKLIGPPPAIIGHEQGGTLTNEVTKRDFCIVLFDELEKSHATIQDIFLQIIDGARLTDGKGKTVNFQNTVIVMTSNLGYTARAKAGLPEELVKFKRTVEDEISKMTDEDIQKLLKRILESYEHLNETTPIFGNEIENIKKLLKGEEVSSDGVVSLAAFKQKKAGNEDKKKLRRDYVVDFMNYYIDFDYGETFLDISTLQYYYACLNYFQDTKPLTAEDRKNLEDTLKKIARIYELDYRRQIISSIAEGKKPDKSIVEQLKQLTELNTKSSETQRQFFIDKMYKDIQDNLTKAVRNAFRQEFLNKLGEKNIITFSPLTKGALRLILKLKLKEISKALAKDGFGELQLSDEVTELVIKEGFRPDMGARPLIRALRKIVLEPLAETILKKQLLPDRVITAYLPLSPSPLPSGERTEVRGVAFKQEQAETKILENGESIKKLLAGLKDGSIKDTANAFKILGLQTPSSLPSPLRGEGEVEGVPAVEQGNNKIDFTIKLPSPEEEDVMKVDNNRLTEIEQALKEQVAELKEYVQQLESRQRTVTESSQRQILRTEISQINKKLEFANGQLRLIELRKQQKLDDAKKLQEELNSKRQTETSEKEQEINDAFENISITAQENRLEEKPVDPSIVYTISEILKSRHRNDAFIVEPSFLVQRNVVEEMARRTYEEKDPVFAKTRFLRLKLTKLSGSLGIIGAFEGTMRGLLNAIHQDNLKKGIKTIVIIDIAEIQKEIERIRFNPFLLSFFLRLFHKDTDISFIMTSSNNSAVSEDVFERYFKDLQIKPQDLNNILEALVICSENWLAEKSEKMKKTSVPQIPFDIKQRALKIWRQFYSGEPPLETIKEWFKGVNDRRVQGLQEISRDRENLLKKTANRIKAISDEMAEEEAKEWTTEKLVTDKELLNLLAQLSNLDKKEEALLRTKGAITKEELDSEILRQERAKADLRQGEEIDISSIDINPEERALNLESNLNRKIFGQEAAVKRVSTAVKINTAGLRMRNQPVGSFLYGGPTGVGKTETAKQTAKAMGMRFFRIDMSEFKSREDVWKLIGAPRGYIGWDEGEGTFIDWMRKYPRTVILFDEVEKGHPDIFNLLLQILEDGIVTSNRGKTVDFSESIIFMTTNLGVKEEVILENGRRETVFDMYPEMEEVYKSGDAARIDDFNKRMTDRVTDRINLFFRPELLNRLDAVEVFFPFTKDKILPIAKKMLRVRFEQLEEEHGIKIIYDEETLNSAAEALKEAGFSPKSGAREIERMSKEWITQGFRPILKSIKDAPRDTRVKFIWQSNKISFQIEQSEETNKIPEQIAERIGLLFTWLSQSKGEELKPLFIKELFYPMEAKQKTTGAKAPFTDKATIQEVKGASPTKTDPSVDEIVSKIGTDSGTVTDPIFDWLKEAIGLSKRINLWRYVWEKDRRSIPDFWELGRADIKRLYDEYQENDKLGDKKIEVLYEIENTTPSPSPLPSGERVGVRVNNFLIGVRINSSLGRELERMLIESKYETENDVRTKLHRHKNLQGFAIAALKLKQAGVDPVRGRPAEGTATTASGRSASNGVDMRLELGKDSTTLWIKIPVKQPKVKQAEPARRGVISPTTQELQLPEGCTIEETFMINNKLILKLKNPAGKFKLFEYKEQEFMPIIETDIIGAGGTIQADAWFDECGTPINIGGRYYFTVKIKDKLAVIGPDGLIGTDIKGPDGKPTNGWFDNCGFPEEVNGKCFIHLTNGGKSAYVWPGHIPGGRAAIFGKNIKGPKNEITNGWFESCFCPKEINGVFYYTIRVGSEMAVIELDGLPDGRTEIFGKSTKAPLNVETNGWFESCSGPANINNECYVSVTVSGPRETSKSTVINKDGNYLKETNFINNLPKPAWFDNCQRPMEIGGKFYVVVELYGKKALMGPDGIIGESIKSPSGAETNGRFDENSWPPIEIEGKIYMKVKSENKLAIIGPNGIVGAGLKGPSGEEIDGWYTSCSDPQAIGGKCVFSATLPNCTAVISADSSSTTVLENVTDSQDKTANGWSKNTNVINIKNIDGNYYLEVYNRTGKRHITGPEGIVLSDIDNVSDLYNMNGYLTFVYKKDGKYYIYKKILPETKPFITRVIAGLVSVEKGTVTVPEPVPSSAPATSSAREGAISDFFGGITDRKIPPADYIKTEAKNILETTAVSPDGKYIAAGGDDKILRLYNSETGELIAEIDDSGGWGGWVQSLSFSPDGRFLAVGTDDNHKVRLIEIDGKSNDDIKEALRNANGPNRVFAETGNLGGKVKNLSFSPDGRFLAVGTDDKKMRLIEIDGKSNDDIKEAFKNANDPAKVFAETDNLDNFICSLIFSPDGKFLAVGISATVSENHRVRLIEIGGKSDDEIKEIFKNANNPKKIFAKTGNLGGNIWGLSFSPDGRFLAVGTGDNHKVRLIELGEKSDTKIKEAFRNANKPDKVFAETGDLGGRVCDLSFSPGGMFLAVGISLEGNDNHRVLLIKVGGKNDAAIKAAFKNANNPKKIFAETGNLGGSVWSLSFSRDGSVFCFTAGTKLHIYRKVKGKPSAYFEEMTQTEINPQIKRITKDRNGPFRILKKGRRNRGWYEKIDETIRPDRKVKGGLVEADKYEDLVNQAMENLITQYANLDSHIDEFDAWVVKGVNFSGHYGKIIRRIYIPIELLEILSTEPPQPNLLPRGEKAGMRVAILTDFIEHEYLHARDRSEEQIRANSEKKRPGVYEQAKKIFRDYVADKLVESVTTLTPTLSPVGGEGVRSTGEGALAALKTKLDNILTRVQNGQPIELSETRLFRLLWLIDRSKEVNLAPEIAELVNLILEPNYTGDPGQVVMALETVMLEALVKPQTANSKQQLGKMLQEELRKLPPARREEPLDTGRLGTSV